MTNLTEKETKTVETLIRLGDSKELATQTVLNDRDRKARMADAEDTYRIAYAS